MFPIISLSVPSFSFILMFFNQCRFSIHPTLITHSTEIVASTPTTQTATETVLECFLCVVKFVMNGCVVLCDAWL
jgi:hypothetical protein